MPLIHCISSFHLSNCNYIRFLRLSYHLQCSVANCIPSCARDLDLGRIYFINSYLNITIFTRKWIHSKKPIRQETKFAFNWTTTKAIVKFWFIIWRRLKEIYCTYDWRGCRDNIICLTIVCFSLKKNMQTDHKIYVNSHYAAKK